MFYQLPPVGCRIAFGRRSLPENLLRLTFGPFEPHFYGSGTMALAAALIAAVKAQNKRAPEVIIPAYSCPNLISAIFFAGAKPVLIDIEPKKPWLNIDQLNNKINQNTVAIVAVHLFGIAERVDRLREVANQAGIALIEDCAQSFPARGENPNWQGDYVILSFGRGKPIGLLTGGAVLCRDRNAGRLLPLPSDQSVLPGWSSVAAFWLKTRVYNVFISPRFYWAVRRIPFLHLGETRYVPLSELNAPSSWILPWLACNIERYQSKKNLAQEWICKMINRNNTGRILDLAATCSNGKQPRLLRYPLLISDPALRDSLYTRLDRAGLGASRMYPAPLNQIPGLEELILTREQFPNALEFSQTILTLPMHGAVRQADVMRMEKIINDTVNGPV